MQHAIAIDQLGPGGEAMTAPIEACVHCGFCLPTCPTYVTMGEEMDSPRGRILLIKEVLEGSVELDSAIPYLDNCLGCQACETACPSGVAYGQLITSFRAHVEQRRERPVGERLERALVLQTLPFPWRFRVAARLGRAARPLSRFLPESVAAMLSLLPDQLPAASRLPALVPAQGRRRARVALLTGCAQRVLAPDISRATIRVLAANGVEVAIPAAQGCCGALAMHTGAATQARRAARRNLGVFPTDVDAVITTAAGCGSGIGEYPLLFAGEPDAGAAAELAAKATDVSVFLSGLGLVATPPPLSQPLTVAYHDACHLAHAQGVRQEPRELLGAIGGLELVEPREWQLCCGSAGTYNVERPATAAELGTRKADNLIATGARLVATGNIGCIAQIQAHLRAQGSAMPVLHTIQVLDRAYAGTLLDPGAATV